MRATTSAAGRLCQCLAALSALHVSSPNTWAVPPTTQPERTFRVQLGPAATVATVECLDTPVFRLRGESCGERAEQAAAALREAFFSGESLPPPASVTGDRQPVLVVAGRPVLTVTREDAEANDTDPRSLAEVWAKNLTGAFERWARKPLPSALVVPLGAVSRWRVGMREGEPQTVRLDPEVVTVTREGGEILLRGQAVGTTRGAIYWGAMEVPVAVTVLPVAADVAPATAVTLSGADVPASVRQRALRVAARTATRLHVGAQVTTRELPDAGTGPRVRVQVTAPQGIDVKRDVRVELGYRPLPVADCQRLLVSNAPERIRRPGALFGSRLTGRSRLLYHHLNDAGQGLMLLVEIVNTGDAEEEVGVMLSAAGPAADEMHVGHKAARSFLRARSRAEGFTLSVPAGGVAPLVEDPMPAGRILSGLAELLPATSAGNLAVRVRAVPRDSGGKPPQDLQETPRFVFDRPLVRTDAAYTVGGDWAFVSIGRHPLTSTTGDYQLAGNYGVLYDVTLALHNPMDEPVPVKLVFAPAGGVARGTFVVAGKHVDVPMTRSGSESLIDVIPLPAGGRRTVRVITMPESASNYPIRLVARAD